MHPLTLEQLAELARARIDLAISRYRLVVEGYTVEKRDSQVSGAFLLEPIKQVGPVVVKTTGAALLAVP